MKKSQLKNQFLKTSQKSAQEDAELDSLARLIYDHMFGAKAKDNHYIKKLVTKERLEEICEINRWAYPGLSDNAYMDIEVMTEWFYTSPGIFPVAIADTRTNKLEAYIAVVPLRENTYQNFKAGKIIDADLTLNDIRPLKKGHNNCLLMDIASKKRKLTKPAAATFFYGFLSMMNFYRKNGFEIDNFLIDICSEKGLKFSNTFLNLKRINATNYEGAPAFAGLYEGQLKPNLFQKIEQKIALFKAQEREKQINDEKALSSL